MPARATPRGSAIIPTMRYRDAPAAIDWLVRVLGFQARLIVPGENDGEIAHAQLTLEAGPHPDMIMLGSARDDDCGALVQAPASPAAPLTQAAYIVVPDIKAHYAHAKAAGAEIVMELADQDYGGKLYSCRDPQGQLWNIGSYNPWTDGGQ